MSVITGLAAGAAAAGFSGFTGAATGLEDFSAAVGFASSSAMMRRIDAKISSIEGSWTLAGCVISDSTSSTPPDHDPIKLNRITISSLCLSMIFSENRLPLFRIMLEYPESEVRLFLRRALQQTSDAKGHQQPVTLAAFG
jgi:hypothetical protein